MKKSVAILFAMLLLFGIVGISNATILPYSLSGTMRLADTNWDNIHTIDIFGELYISDIPINYDP